MPRNNKILFSLQGWIDCVQQVDKQTTGTKFVVVKCVHSYDANTTTETMCEVFSEFGLPDNIHSDRGRNFLSECFTKFLNTLGIDLTYCSAYHHSSNPAEWAIRNMKNLMKCCASAGKPWHIALLEYLSTPLRTGLPSPAVMMGREFRGLLPQLSHFLPDSTKEQLVLWHEKQVCPGGHDLPDISVGSNVTFLDHRTKEWYPAKVQNREGRSYVLQNEQGHTISHNHVDIRPTNVSFNLSPKCKAVRTSQFCASVPTSKNSKSTPVSQPTASKANVSKSQSRPVTRTHIIKLIQVV